MIILNLRNSGEYGDENNILIIEDENVSNIFSSTLNNFAAISSSYNVIKPFNFKIIIKNDDYKIENIK